MTKYICFTRRWWRLDDKGNVVPHAGRRRTVAVVDSEEAARDVCREWNRTHKPGRFSLKCEYTAGSRLP